MILLLFIFLLLSFFSPLKKVFLKQNKIKITHLSAAIKSKRETKNNTNGIEERNALKGTKRQKGCLFRYKRFKCMAWVYHALKMKFLSSS